MGSHKAQTVGYRYSISMHMAWCHGPVDEVMELRASDRTVWQGERYGAAVYTQVIYRWLRPKDFTLPVTSTSPVIDNEEITVFAPNAFGGDDREGGLYGQLEIMMGADTQVANSYLTTAQGALQPAYRGVLTFLWKKGLVSSNNPYIKPWAARLKRITKGWDTTVWNPTKVSIDLGGGVIAMNPAHIIYECFTNRKWGHGMSDSKLDLASFTTAAATLYTEGFGLCIAWMQQELINEFVQRIVNHIGAAVGEDPKTGLYRLKLIRDDYTLGALPVFSYEAGNLVSVENFERAATSEVKNELTIKYNDQKVGKSASVTVQNVAAVKNGGTQTSDTTNYPGIPTQDLATRVALRDLRAATSGIARASIVCNRAAADLLSGDVFAFSWPAEGITLMPMRVVAIDYGSVVDGQVRIECVQDVFGLPATTYVEQQPAIWVEPSRVPVASPAIKVFEQPYRALVRTLSLQTAEGLTADAAYLASIAQRPTGANYGYQLETRTGAAEYLNNETGEWCPTGTIPGNIAVGSANVSFTLANPADVDLVGPGSAAFIDEEEFRVVSIDRTTLAIVLARGCGDTVPAAHTTGARVWFYESFEAQDPTEWATGEVVDARLRTITTETLLATGSSPTGSVTMAKRANRPFPPGLFKINTNAYPATVPVGSNIVVSWAHRDRLGQQDQLVDTLASDIGPEAGVTYTLQVINTAGPTTLATVTGITGNTSTVLLATLGAAVNVRLKLWAVRAGLDSRQMHDWTVTRV